MDYDIQLFIPIPNGREDKLKAKLKDKGIPENQFNIVAIGSFEFCEATILYSTDPDDYDYHRVPKCAYEINEALYDLVSKLMREVKAEKCLYLWGCKKEPDDALRECFKTGDFYDAVNKLGDWVSEELKMSYILFGDDDVNGYEIAGWNVDNNLVEDVLHVIKLVRVKWFRRAKGGCHFYDQKTEKALRKIKVEEWSR